MHFSVSRRGFLKTSCAVSTGMGLLSLSTNALGAAQTAPGAPHAEHLGWRLACNAYTYNKLTFYETIDKVAALGLKHIVTEERICVPFGTGKTDMRGIFKELRRQGFRGVLGIEYGQRTSNSEEEIVQSVSFVDKVAQELAAT